MTDANPLAERGRALEDDYFRRQDRELLDRMRSASAPSEEHRRLATATGLNHADVQELQRLEFTPDTVALLPIVPLVQVAWAEGGVSDEERALIVRFARGRGIGEASAADLRLSAWLSAAPDADVVRVASRVVKAMLERRTGSGHDLTADDIVAYCERIAAVSGGFLRMNRVAPAERAVLDRIARQLTASPEGS